MSGDVIIRKQKINIKVGNEKLAFDCQQTINEQVSDELVKMYERIFHQTTHPDQYIAIDSIKVDLGVISVYDFQNRFYQLIEQQLLIELRKQFEKSPELTIVSTSYTEPPLDATEKEAETIQYSSASAQESAALVYFLEKGFYPWWYKKNKRKTPNEILKGFDEIQQSNFLIQIYAASKKLSAYNEVQLIKRLSNYLSNTIYETLLISLVELQADDRIRNNLFLLLNQKNQISQYFHIPVKIFYQKFFRFFLLNRELENGIKSFLASLNQSFPLAPEDLKPQAKFLEGLDEHILSILEKKLEPFPELPARVKKNKSINLEDPEGIYIENAGLVLLHPFLPVYFQNLGLVNDARQFISEEAKVKASILLYYLQEGTADYKEWEMALNKILCGIETTEVIESEELSEQEIKESKLLLQTVVGYWTALKGASPESLQETFLKREGKITFKEDFWLIQVEKMGVDILLERLPWGIGTIKLPWLKEIIYVEW